MSEIGPRLDDFAELPLWVAWQGEPAERSDAPPKKVPYSANGRTGRASATDPKTWGPRRAAIARAAALPRPCGLGGIGVVLTEIGNGNWLCGIDLDTCRDPRSGNLATWAEEVVTRFASYAEVSPSQTGVKLFFCMTTPDRDATLSGIRAITGDPRKEGNKWAHGTAEDHPPAIELYLGKRYFTVTGNKMEGVPEELRVVDADTVRWLVRHAGPAFSRRWGDRNGHDPDGRPRDESRSAEAMRIGHRMAREGKSYEEFCAAVRANPETADWYHEKGTPHDARELKRIWKKVHDRPLVEASSGPPWKITPSAPYDTAKLFLKEMFTVDARSILHRHRGGFYLWNGAAYPEIAESEVRARAYAFLDQCVQLVLDKATQQWETSPVKPNARTVNDLLDALRAVALLQDTISAPAWLEQVTDLDPRDVVACANGLLHLPTLNLFPHTPVFFSHNALDYSFEPKARAPNTWLGFLGQLWPDDAQSIDTLQEIFGYMLVSDTSQQKAFLLVGPKRSGKGTIGRVLARLVGAENAVAPTLAGLGTNFGLQPLIGKRVAIISDARLGGRADQSAIAERLLSITGEDAITVDRKYREPWTGRLETRFLVLTNELPRLNDASGALASRFIVLVLTESFYGREDHGLSDRLILELPEILNWVIEGWRRLQERGYFVQPASAEEMIADLEDLGSPIGAFLRDCCEVKPGKSVLVDSLFSVWQSWCMEQNREKYTGTKQSFGRDIRAAVPGLKTTQVRTKDGCEDRRHRMYEGIGLAGPPVTAADLGL